MKLKYKTNAKGKMIPYLKIYEEHEHRIDNKLLDKRALDIIFKLQKVGHEAYIVGGAVRDLLAGQDPKDIDIVTDAHPNKIKKLFPNAQNIGRRFKIIHIKFGEDFFEVVTFRSGDAGDNPNSYGTIEEDVKRRDFTVNALYYDPQAHIVLDFLTGYEDLKNKVLKNVIPLNTIFIEDPVRIIRGAKYMANLNLKASLFIHLAMKKDVNNLEKQSMDRITDEIYKILLSKNRVKIIENCYQLNIFKYIFPRLHEALKDKPFKEKLYDHLEKFGDEKDKCKIFGKIIASVFNKHKMFNDSLINSNIEDFVKELRDFCLPLKPVWKDHLESIKYIYADNSLDFDKRLKELKKIEMQEASFRKRSELKKDSLLTQAGILKKKRFKKIKIAHNESE